MPIFDPNAFYVFDRKKSCNNEGGDSSMKSYEIISYILGRAVTLNGSDKDFPGPCENSCTRVDVEGGSWISSIIFHID